MTVNCGLCGEKIIVADNISNGQHICCPHCKGELEYKKPVQMAFSQEATKSSKNAVPERLKLKRKAKSHIVGIRSLYYVVAILIASIAIAVIVTLNDKSEEKSGSRQPEQSQRIEPKQQQLAQEMPIANRQEEVRKLADVEAREKTTEVEERVDEVVNKKTSKEVLQKRDEALDQIRVVKFDYFQNCPEDERPLSPKANMTYICVIPKLGKRVDVIELIASPGKEIAIMRYTEDGECVSISLDEFKTITAKSAYLLMTDRDGWLCGAQNNGDGVQIINSRSLIDPAEEEFGVLMCETLQHYSAKMSTVAYSVYFTDKKGNRRFIRRVAFGDTVTADIVNRVMREELQEKLRTMEREKRYQRNGRFNITEITEKLLYSGKLCYVSNASDVANGDEKVGEFVFDIDNGSVDEDVKDAKASVENDEDKEQSAEDLGLSKQDVVAEIKSLKRSIAENNREIKQLRKENPACLDNPESDKTIRPLFIKRRTQEQYRYYENCEVTYVRDRFFCTGCNKEHDTICPSSQTAYRKWREAKNNISKTLKINEQLDALYEKNATMTQRIEELSTLKKSR